MEAWGSADGSTVHRHRLVSEAGLALTVATFGARVVDLRLPVAGDTRPIVLGHPRLADYVGDRKSFMGASIGRVANRIAGAEAELDGRRYRLATAPGETNQLHGGPDAFDRRVWAVDSADDRAIRLTLTSPDGDQGFPGQVDASVEYSLVGDRHDTEVTVVFRAVTDAPTWVNLTQHTYWNLDGPGGDVRAHRLQVPTDRYLPVDADGIPTGEVAAVHGPWDLRSPRRLGPVLADPELTPWGGLDHNYVLDGAAPAATLQSGDRLVRLELETDRPGLQVYTANGFPVGRWPRHGGIALEAQAFPDSPHHPEWPSIVLRPGEEYLATTRWWISVGSA